MRSMISGTVMPVGGVGSVAPKPSCAARAEGNATTVTAASATVDSGRAKATNAPSLRLGTIVHSGRKIFMMGRKLSRFTAYVSRRGFAKKGLGDDARAGIDRCGIDFVEHRGVAAGALGDEAAAAGAGRPAGRAELARRTGRVCAARPGGGTP